MNQFKRGIMRILVILMYFTVILMPISMIIDILLEIEENLEVRK